MSKRPIAVLLTAAALALLLSFKTPEVSNLTTPQGNSAFGGNGAGNNNVTGVTGNNGNAGAGAGAGAGANSGREHRKREWHHHRNRDQEHLLGPGDRAGRPDPVRRGPGPGDSPGRQDHRCPGAPDAFRSAPLVGDQLLRRSAAPQRGPSGAGRSDRHDLWRHLHERGLHPVACSPRSTRFRPSFVRLRRPASSGFGPGESGVGSAGRLSGPCAGRPGAGPSQARAPNSPAISSAQVSILRPISEVAGRKGGPSGRQGQRHLLHQAHPRPVGIEGAEEDSLTAGSYLGGQARQLARIGHVPGTLPSLSGTSGPIGPLLNSQTGRLSRSARRRWMKREASFSQWNM